MKFEIDVSGCDIFQENYVICIAKDDGETIKGFKLSKSLIDYLIANWKANKYKYDYNQYETKRGIFKVRVYSIIIYYLFKSLKEIDWLSLTICRDFKGRINEINQNLNFFLGKLLNIKIGKPLYQKLANNSYAHIYAGMMRKDNKNLLNTYVNITLEDIEKFLKKKNKVTPRGR